MVTGDDANTLLGLSNKSSAPPSAFTMRMKRSAAAPESSAVETLALASSSSPARPPSSISAKTKLAAFFCLTAFTS